MPNGKQITNNNLYDFIDKVRLELKSDNNAAISNVMAEVRGLRSDFTDLERGRLTRAEGNISQLGLDLQKAINSLSGSIDGVRQSGGTLSAKFALVGSIVLIILSGLSAAAFYKLIVK